MINQSSADRISGKLTEEYGITIKGIYEVDEDAGKINFIPEEIDLSEGFFISAKIGWRSMNFEFIPGNFSALLICSMGDAGCNKREMFKAVAEETIKIKEQISMKINDIPVDPTDIYTWPNDWKRFQLSIKIMPVPVEHLSDNEMESKIFHCVGRLLTMVLSLLPLDEADTETENLSAGLPEGAVIRIEVNRYERNRLNRAVCIEKNGYVCIVCGFDFAKSFGCIGDGFINVHHVTPVSKIGNDYIINPVIDLVPVCPNCHAMLHRKDPPYTIDELINIIDHMKSDK